MLKTIHSIFFVFLLMPFAISAQVIHGVPDYSTTIWFASDSLTNFVPDTSSTPLWQIGRTHKSFFTTDSAGAVAIMTDTLNSYPINANNWFIIKISGFNTIVNFWHKYQTDSGHDGGIVEYSADTGVTWQNVKNECNVDSLGGGIQGIHTANFYSTLDTLMTGEPSFTGTSNSVQLSSFQFFNCWPARITGGAGCALAMERGAFYVRFRFVSDSVVDSLAGWKIDSLQIENDDYGSGGVTKINKQKSINTYPNPSYNGTFTFPPLENEQTYTIEVFNVMGQKIVEKPYSHTIDIGKYVSGLYFYSVTNGTEYYSGQLQFE